VTVAGTVAEVEFELRETTKPAVGAVPARVTFPVEFNPPTTEFGLKLTE
jgi:hypothetical protein